VNNPNDNANILPLYDTGVWSNPPLKIELMDKYILLKNVRNSWSCILANPIN